MLIKICGITNKDDAMNAVMLGADAIGFIFAEGSPRRVTPEQVEEIIMFLPPFVHLVGVFVDQSRDFITQTVTQCKLDLIQLHGAEPPEFCLNLPRRVIKAFKMRDIDDLDPISSYQGIVTAALLDTKVDDMHGGTGQSFDWGLAIQAKELDIPLILAGGITSANLNKAAQLVNPYAVDLSSGVEAEPGKKDYNKLEEIISLAKSL